MKYLILPAIIVFLVIGVVIYSPADKVEPTAPIVTPRNCVDQSGPSGPALSKDVAQRTLIVSRPISLSESEAIYTTDHLDEIGRMTGVESVSAIRSVHVQSILLEEEEIEVSPITTARTWSTVISERISLAEGCYPEIGRMQVIVSDVDAQEHGIELGDQLEIDLPEEEPTLYNVTGIFESDQNTRFIYYISRPDIPTSKVFEQIIVLAHEGSDMQALKDEMHNILFEDGLLSQIDLASVSIPAQLPLSPDPVDGKLVLPEDEKGVEFEEDIMPEEGAASEEDTVPKKEAPSKKAAGKK